MSSTLTGRPAINHVSLSALLEAAKDPLTTEDDGDCLASIGRDIYSESKPRGHSHRRPNLSFAEAEESFRQACIDAGLVLEESPIFDGQWHRVRLATARNKTKKNGSYKAIAGEWPIGWIKDWTSPEGPRTWKPETPTRSLTPHEYAELCRKREHERLAAEKEQLRQQEIVSNRAQEEWDRSPGALPTHPYLVRKGIPPHDLKIDSRGNLLIPMRDADGQLWGLQRIDADGNKRFPKNGRVKGTFHIIGRLEDGGPIGISESFGTGASVYSFNLFNCVVLTFGCENLKSVGEIIRRKCPNSAIVFAADNNDNLPREPLLGTGKRRENVGIVKATQAAATVDGTVVHPESTAAEAVYGTDADHGTDWNDCVVLHGLKAARRHFLQKLLVARSVPTGAASISSGHGEACAVGQRQSRRKPEPLDDAALHGVIGDIVRTIMPHTESGEPALLIQLLVALGSYLGRTGYYLVEGDNHYTNLFAVIVGRTAKARKGTGWGRTRQLLDLVDQDYMKTCQKKGISSGEGIIWAVRDPIRQYQQPKSNRCQTGDYEEVVTDPGISDKRLLFQEPEFARVLKAINRDTNNASAVIRDAWDTGTLSTITKNTPARATNAHISIIGHSTTDDLRKFLTDTEVANGFGNRFLWVYSERSKRLPFGGEITNENLMSFAPRLRSAYQHAQVTGRINFDAATKEVWPTIYDALTEERPGLLGAMTGRAEAQVIRLAVLYALLDCESAIRIAHLKAALAVWEYCEASAGYIFGDSLGDDTADAALRFLRSVGEAGATRTEISAHFKRNKSSSEIGRALDVLNESGLAVMTPEQGDGKKSIERWRALDRTQRRAA